MHPLLRIQLIPDEGVPEVVLDVIGYALRGWALAHRRDEVAELALSLITPLLRGAITFQVYVSGVGRIWLQVFVPEEVPIGDVAIWHVRETVSDGTVFSAFVDHGPAPEPPQG